MLSAGLLHALLFTVLIIVDDITNGMPTSGIGETSARNNMHTIHSHSAYVPSTAGIMERSLSINESKTATPTSSENKASPILYNHRIIFGEIVAINDSTNATRSLMTAYTAITTTAHENWKSEPALKRYSITTGSIDIALVSDVPIAWDCVSSIGKKLIALAKARLIGFFGAVFFCPNNGLQNGMVAVAIGVSLVAITNMLLLAKMPNFRGDLGTSVGLLPAEVLAANMLNRYGLAAPAAR